MECIGQQQHLSFVELQYSTRLVKTWSETLPIASRCLKILFKETLLNDAVRISRFHRILRTTMENQCLTAIQHASGYQRILIRGESAFQERVFNAVHRDDVTQLVCLLLRPPTSKLGRGQQADNIARRTFDEVAERLECLVLHGLSSDICKVSLRLQMVQRNTFSPTFSNCLSCCLCFISCSLCLCRCLCLCFCCRFEGTRAWFSFA